MTLGPPGAHRLGHLKQYSLLRNPELSINFPNFQGWSGKYLLENRFQPPGWLKGAVSRDFRTLFFSLIKPIWAPDEHAKMVFLKNSFSRRYSNLKFEKFDSAQTNTARSRNFSTS